MRDHEADADCRRGIPGQRGKSFQHKNPSVQETTGTEQKGWHIEKMRLTFIIVELSFRGFCGFASKFGLPPNYNYFPARTIEPIKNFRQRRHREV